MNHAEDTPRKDSKVEGEGSYTAARDYQKSVRSFVSEKQDQIEELAESAEAALEGEEGELLRRAEEEGRSHARK